MTHRKTWVFPSFETTRIACHAAAAARVAYYAARRKMETLGAQYSCSLTMGVLDGQSLLIFTWEPGVDERLPALVDAIALLTSGMALQTEETYGTARNE